MNLYLVVSGFMLGFVISAIAEQYFDVEIPRFF